MSMMDTAKALVAGCREGREAENLERLYAPDAISVEAADMGRGREVRGLDAIRAKHDWWEASMEVLEAETSDPLPHGDDRFAVIFRVTAREKETGKTWDMEEVGVYTVADDRIVREEFFYAMS
ncbi:nuclear transport factor 2 family protein [Roseovarius sp. SCSIO 43702]|uniref:nuclear transport factor 2 family protein n=1 Tax=Roseovarius sp. SCSIO 43702 TaxID=2823043 RepID=UPI001C73CB71|nr:nuclear transport factor 2 family protein [Roseovarius sp. SCSIO 43702]QYX55336.1 nuclear transport factor 2 family protein [Roseovarius sp. SCSIO 43702]